MPASVFKLLGNEMQFFSRLRSFAAAAVAAASSPSNRF
jgi:hypothetical protein